MLETWSCVKIGTVRLSRCLWFHNDSALEVIEGSYADSYIMWSLVVSLVSKLENVMAW